MQLTASAFARNFRNGVNAALKHDRHTTLLIVSVGRHFDILFIINELFNVLDRGAFFYHFVS